MLGSSRAVRTSLSAKGRRPVAGRHDGRPQEVVLDVAVFGADAVSLEVPDHESVPIEVMAFVRLAADAFDNLRLRIVKGEAQRHWADPRMRVVDSRTVVGHARQCQYLRELRVSC